MKTISWAAIPIGIALWAIPAESQQTLNVAVEGPGKVTGAGINCPGDCSETALPTYIGLRPRPAAPVTVVLTAQPNEGSVFRGWTGCAVNAEAGNTCTASVPSGGATVIARFGAPVSLSVLRITIEGGGKVSGSGATCLPMCAIPRVGTFTTTLTATPEAGHVFDHWSGVCEGTAQTCTVTVSGQKDVVARFSGPGSLSILRMTIEGAGSVTCLPTCGTPRVGPFTTTLTATPEAGHVFDHWSGLCEGTAPTCTVSVLGQRDVVAHFKPSQ